MTTLLAGTVLPYKQPPVAVPVADPTYGVVGSVIQVSGQQSNDPTAQPPKSGTDSSTVSSTNTINTPTGHFSASDVDRIIVLTGIDAGSYIITSVTSATQVQVLNASDGGTVLFLGGSSSWSIVDSLAYSWSFVSVPIGSIVETEGFRQLEPDNVLVSFSPDIVGEYIIGLKVSNGVFESPVVTTQVSIRAILVPHARGIVPDGKFIWSYIRDVWQEVEGKEIFETFWSALIQIIGGELLKLYQNDFNKSIRDIQDLYQRRWLSYEPKLELVEDDCTFYIGNSAVGLNATAANLGLQGKGILISSGEMLVVEGSVLPSVSGEILTITFDILEVSNIRDYLLAGTNTSKTGYKLSPPTVLYPAPNPTPDKVATAVPFIFDFQSTTWTLMGAGSYDYALAFSQSPSPIDEFAKIFDNGGAGVFANLQAGDYVHYPGGPNAGVYKIVDRSGSFIIVDHAPPGASDDSVGAVTANVYKPIGFKVSQPDQIVSKTFAVPLNTSNDISQLAVGRVVILGGQAYKILRVQDSTSQLVPLSIITTDGGAVLTGLNGLSWRVADTLVSSSQDFEALGVSSGDLLVFDVTNSNSQTISQVRAQVIGVVGNSLAFALTDQPITPGVVPPIPNHTYESLSDDFGILSVTENVDGSLTFSGDALAVMNVINSGNFKRQYWNVPLTNQSVFSILGGNFQVNPRFIIRNHLIPIDSTLKSVPVLQDWIVQPQVTQHDGKVFHLKNGVEYEIPNVPYSLVENTDYLVDNETAFLGTMTFETGTDILNVESGMFLSRGLRPGDQFVISSPATLAATYYISSIISDQEVRLSRPIPLYVLGTVVTAEVEIRRARTGRFIRFVPGGFTALNPAPNRLWAEVSFFNNFDSVENNFGILVGLTRADLEAVSSNINYRQAVAGLMFAFVNGPTINKVRLGAQILLGLPFAESTGIIRSIENDYRLDVHGDAVLGRLLIEDTDATGTALGTLRVYTFPIDPVSELAGLETNPDTGKPYAVGDSVALFAALSKGVEVDDYITNPEDSSFSSIAQLQQFHSIRIRANDSIFTLKELGLLSTFLRRITPSYIATVIASDIEIADDVPVLDDLTLGLSNDSNPIVDNASLGLPAALVFDSITPNGVPQILLDDGVFWVRLSGKDLSTTYNGGTPSLTAHRGVGGFVTPFFGEGPITRVGDKLLIRSGPNEGLYPITTVSSDTDVVVSGLPASGFQTAIQPFAVLRPTTGIIRTGVTATTGSSSTLIGDVGLQADGVMPGDKILIIYFGSDWSTHLISQVGGPSGPIPAGNLLLDSPAIETCPDAVYYVIRERLMASPFSELTGILVSNGSAYTFVTTAILALVDIGDELQVQEPAQRRVVVFDTRNSFFYPVLPAGSYTVKVCKREHPETTIGFDHIEKFDPFDVVEVGPKNPDSNGAAITTGSDRIVLSADASVLDPDLDLHAKPGDFLVLLTSPGSFVQLGYGPGILPIVQVDPGGLQEIQIGSTMGFTGTSAWKIVRRR